MRALLVLAVLLLPSFAFSASEVIVVERVAVKVGGLEHVVYFAKVGRAWLRSWNQNRADVRQVTLRAVSADGTLGQARTYEGCTLASFEAPLGGGDATVATRLELSCRE